MQIPSEDARGNYTVFAAPGLTAGFRYNFRNGLGLRTAFSMETLQLDRYQFNRFGTSLPDTVNLTEGRLGVAVAYLF
jgi:hypothetical protein